MLFCLVEYGVATLTLAAGAKLSFGSNCGVALEDATSENGRGAGEGVSV
jgi:hypothetical protein